MFLTMTVVQSPGELVKRPFLGLHAHAASSGVPQGTWVHVKVTGCPDACHQAQGATAVPSGTWADRTHELWSAWPLDVVPPFLPIARLWRSLWEQPRQLPATAHTDHGPGCSLCASGTLPNLPVSPSSVQWGYHQYPPPKVGMGSTSTA